MINMLWGDNTATLFFRSRSVGVRLLKKKNEIKTKFSYDYLNFSQWEVIVNLQI